MQILKLSFENINSLKGAWTIDFQAPDFRSGIFAIVGPTGSGKTTILDAICLALYGHTPRIGSITQNANVPFFSMSGSEFVEMFVGAVWSSKHLADVIVRPGVKRNRRTLIRPANTDKWCPQWKSLRTAAGFPLPTEAR